MALVERGLRLKTSDRELFEYTSSRLHEMGAHEHCEHYWRGAKYGALLLASGALFFASVVLLLIQGID